MFKLFNPTNKNQVFSCIIQAIRGVPSCEYHLQEIGEVEFEKDVNTKYNSGQCFIHKLFAYRGIILCPWRGQLHIRNENDKKKVKPKSELYYQVLIDDRDVPYTKIQTDNDKVNTFSRCKMMFSAPGLDHVSHCDILPFKPTCFHPIKHTLCNRLFAVISNHHCFSMKILPKLHLHEWKRKYQPWLNSTQVHEISKEGVKITAMSFYVGRRKLTYWWLLCIRVENLNNDSVIIQGKDWRISNIVTKELEKVKFRGLSLLSHEAILPPDSAAIQYYDFINLPYPEGVIGCYYRIIKLSDLSPFSCPILLFTLKSTVNDHSHGKNIIDWY